MASFARLVGGFLAVAACGVAATNAIAEAPTATMEGAIVISRDGKIAGVVDAMTDEAGKRTIVVGLAGYLGIGEKDVTVPALSAHQIQSVTRSSSCASSDVYGGATGHRIQVPLTIEELVALPAYLAKPQQTGVPSPHTGSPAESKDKPPSSTHSGGPG